ncbi:ATP-binding protein [Brevibacillus formosus]|uniref:sensor histidine kinase n=1 Tax=Brevibacillus TaxID=55080 RepID=UPI000D0FAF33|nr:MULTISPECIES: HAMP domain-containing sensor histidine kinase [Brevibacillus]MBG9945548.1 histidine kinase [Brevibacillus formosus]MED1943935.1 ATP-binding protein [Brevibacillus formosus]MED1999693.1 ATP-binding protein [Brevibacillus formosus]MED2082170.1 ATP-binding protein [Brevibacillus formosus]PSK18903.1 two-component sensor histidine kinase [Brevibacillus sp. NRRL NRS-603]
MRTSIVLKLFLLTTGLCLFVIASIFIGQTVFFEQYYVHQKVEKVKEALQSYRQNEMTHAGASQDEVRKEQEFYQKTNAWLARLDDRGHLKYSDDFEMEVRLEYSEDTPALSGKSIIVPLYTVMDVEDVTADNPFLETYVKVGQQIAMEGIMIDNQWFAQRIGRSVSNLREEDQLENQQLVKKEYEVVPRFKSGTEYHERYPSVLVRGTITQVRTPQGADVSRYTNRLFLERVKAFQADLLYGDVVEQTSTITDFKENDMEYKIFVERVTDQTGKPAYLFAMTSLQPVNEAAEVMKSYYGYIIAGTLLLVLLASFYYSRRIAAPLLRMDDMTQKMAKLDFSEKIPIKTEDEIGSLSRNINRLSDMLHAHIVQLEQDIEKEKRLEQTRKEFIAGVSHELRTPLSIMESCLYILKDKADSPKRDYYFAAMEDEVRKMNLLVTDMLELAKYESGTYRMQMDAFRIDVLLEQICVKLAPDLAGKQLQLHYRLAPVEVIANQHRIEQVIVNFLTNAIRYTPEQEDIVISTVEGEDTVKICIENKGVHIPAEQLEKIWDRFYRVEHSRNRSTGGTGLGLAISKQILELHGAVYGATNTEEGVLFYFELKKTKV